jgi:hypothetical protein
LIDLYCERVGPGLWAEPVNLLSNIGYVCVAWVLVRLAARHAPDDRQLRILAWLPLAIAIGSMLFHAFATSWARRFDEAPILLFEALFLWIYARRRWTWHTVQVATGLVFFVVTVAAGKLVHALNGSVPYLPPLAAGLAIGADAWRSDRRVDLLVAVGLFAVAIGFRVSDIAVCNTFPVGTHFLWHITTAVAIFLFGRVVMDGSRISPR